MNERVDQAKIYFLETVANGPEFKGNKHAYYHCHRFYKSIELLDTYLTKAQNVLELGDPSSFTVGLKHIYPHIKIDNTQGDLRKWTPTPESYDLVINMEVIEHLKDIETPDNLTIYKGDGLKNCLAGCYSALKPGGYMFLTTPNMASLTCIEKLLKGYDPYWWEPHVRELTPQSLKWPILEAGFIIEKQLTFDAYGIQSNRALELQHIVDFLKLHDYEYKYRGEVQAVIAKKL